MSISNTKKSRSLSELKYFNFFMYGSWSLLMPFLPLYFQNEGFNHVQIGLLVSMGPMISLIANPFWGYWSDRLQNIKLVLIIMLIGNIIVSQIYFQMHEFSFVLLFMLLFYFFQTALNPISNSLILTAIEKTKYHFGTFRLWGSLGFAFIVLVASPFIQWVGVGNLGYLYGSFVLITIFLCFRLPNQRKRSAKNKASFKEMSHVFTNKLFVMFLMLSALMSIPNFMNAAFISVYINQLGGSEVYVGWSWFLAAGSEVPIFLLLDRYLKITSRSLFGLMVIASGFYVLRWFLMGIATSPYHIVFIQILHCVSFALGFYLSTQICNLLIPERFRTSGQAMYGLTWMGVGGMIGGLFGGWIFDLKGPEVMYLTGVFMSVVGLFGFMGIWLYFRRKEEQQTQETGAVEVSCRGQI